MKMKKLNIAIVCDGLTNTISGSFISALRFSEQLKKRGHKVIFITSKDSINKEIGYFKEIKTYRFFSMLLPKSEGQLFISFPTVSKIKKILLEEEIDILHTMLPTPSSIIAIKAAKSLGIKIVAHSHAQPENIFLHFPKFLFADKLNELFYKYLLWLYNHADIIICPSKFAERALKKRDHLIKTTIISNGVNISEFKKVNPKPFLKKYNIPLNTKKIVFLGKLNPEKNVKTLINAMPYILKDYQKVNIVIIGFGPTKDSLEELSKKLGLEKYIIFCGKISNDELNMAYSLCDIFVLPSLAELEGMVVLEAMSCNNPILIANSKESASVDFVKGNGFLFKPENPKDLAEKALKLLKNNSLRKKMAAKSYKNVKAYDINKSVDKLEKVYYKLLS